MIQMKTGISKAAENMSSGHHCLYNRLNRYNRLERLCTCFDLI